MIQHEVYNAAFSTVNLFMTNRPIMIYSLILSLENEIQAHGSHDGIAVHTATYIDNSYLEYFHFYIERYDCENLIKHKKVKNSDACLYWNQIDNPTQTIEQMYQLEIPNISDCLSHCKGYYYSQSKKNNLGSDYLTTVFEAAHFKSTHIEHFLQKGFNKMASGIMSISIEQIQNDLRQLKFKNHLCNNLPINHELNPIVKKI